MRKTLFTRMLTLVMAIVMLLSLCLTSASAQETKALTTVTVYPPDATAASGPPAGYRNQFFTDRGIDLQLWAYSPEKTNAILASGDLPDLMYVTYKELEVMIEGNMVLNLDEYLDQIPHVRDTATIQTALNYARMFRSAGTNSIYGIPAQISVPAEGDDTSRNAVKVNWPVYYALGMPEIKTDYDLITLMKQMMEYQPVAADGTKTWGTVLNSGTDSLYWRSIELWYKWHGIELDNLQFLLETDMLNVKYDSILEDNSMYYQGLKWYNTAYREGVLDPDSINNDRNTQKAKVETSRAVMIPSGTTPGWAGYRPVQVGTQPLYAETWGSPYGGDMFIVVNPKTEHLDACLEVLDMLADADLYFLIWNGTEEMGLWYTGEDGYVYPTELGFNQYIVPGSTVTFSTGEDVAMWFDRFIVSPAYSNSYIGPDGPRQPRGMSAWTEIKAELNKSEENTQWVTRFGYETFTKLLKSNNGYTLISPLTNVARFCNTVDDWTQLTLDAIRDVVVNASWKMVYAEDDASFDAIWAQMVKDCKDLGSDDVIANRLSDLAAAKEIKDSLEAK